MTAINFPDTPEVGDKFFVGAITWQWTGTVWKSAFLPDTLPSQTGQDGNFLSTNGESLSWQDLNVTGKAIATTIVFGG
jgi:hypothetical protein